MNAPRLSTIVVSWASKADVLALAARFPDDPGHELIVVDNGGELEPGAERNVRVLFPGSNLGFAGGCNFGARRARSGRLLFLNPDTVAVGDPFGALARGFDRLPAASGLVPRLIDPDGKSQFRWQLRSLPSAPALLAHAFFWSAGRRPREEPAAGVACEQPAAAALALRRETFDAVGGFDERFHPAWFEDVDLARRLRTRGAALVYFPEASFVHRGGASIAPLGYGRFLEAYDRNLALYLRLHHGRAWELAFRALVPIGALLRLAGLPLRKPARAATRAGAARDLLTVAGGAFSGWRREAA